MKKMLRRKGRKTFRIILTLMLVLGIVASTYTVFADGLTGLHLEESWNDGYQNIDYCMGDTSNRSVSAKGNGLWINGWKILYDLYDTGYWCYNREGAIFAINSERKLAYCRPYETSFSIIPGVEACTGFQRDEQKFGYWVYTDYGTFSLSELIHGTRTTNNNNGYNNNYVYYDTRSYPYADKDGNTYYWYLNSSTYYTYYLSGTTLYMTYNGSNRTKVDTSVKDLGFYNYGSQTYVAYLKDNTAYGYVVGTTWDKVVLGKKVRYLEKSNYMTDGYTDTNGVYKYFSISYTNTRYENEDEYPYLEIDGNTYTVYTAKKKYEEYQYSGNVLRYMGNQSTSKNVKLASNVEEIKFSKKGYVVYSTTSNYLNAVKFGKTNIISLVDNKKDFSYFEEYDEYFAEGYIDRYGDYIEFDFD